MSIPSLLVFLAANKVDKQLSAAVADRFLPRLMESDQMKEVQTAIEANPSETNQIKKLVLEIATGNDMVSK
jgi:hypothetical protein